MTPKMLTQEQQQAAAVQVPQVIQETIRRHNVQVQPTANEMNKIMKDAVTKLRSPEMAEIRTRTETAFLDYLKRKKPAEFNRVSTELVGKKTWDYLGAANMQVNVGGQQVSVKQAIADCSKIEDRQQRLERFMDITKQFAEMYRIKGDGTNAFGIKAGELVTDPGRLFSERQINCFSGSITLGTMLQYAARVAGVGDQVKASVMNIPSYSLNGKTWDDSGHALLQVKAGNKLYFFDSTNTMMANHGDIIKVSGEEMQGGFLGTKYKLGATYEVGPAIMSIAKYQDGLLKKVASGGTLTDAQVKALSSMPDSFQSKFINALNEEQQKRFFKSANLSSLSPESRFTLSAVAFKALRYSDPQAALKYAREGVKALEAVIKANRSGRLPIAAVFDNVTGMVYALQRSSAPQDKALLANGSMHTFLANAGLETTGSLNPAQLRAGAAIIADYVTSFRKEFDRADARFKCILSAGLMRMESKAGGVSAKGREAINVALSSMGLRNFDSYLAGVKEQLAQKQPFGPRLAQDPNLGLLVMHQTINIVMWGAGVEGKSFALIREEHKFGDPAVTTALSAVLSTLENKKDELLRPGSQLYTAVSRAGSTT